MSLLILYINFKLYNCIILKNKDPYSKKHFGYKLLYHCKPFFYFIQVRHYIFGLFGLWTVKNFWYLFYLYFAYADH